jgi:hypothetical protein
VRAAVLDATLSVLLDRGIDARPAEPGLHPPAPNRRWVFDFTRVTTWEAALIESTIGLYKTELIKKEGPWRTLADGELATAEYVDWYNNKRLHTAIGGIPPAEQEAGYYAQTQPNPEAGQLKPPRNPGRFKLLTGASGCLSFR